MNFKACMICADKTSHHSSPLGQSEEGDGTRFLLDFSKKSPIMRGLITAFLRENKKRNIDSKEILHPLEGDNAGHPAFMYHQMDRGWIFPQHTADPVCGGWLFLLGHLTYSIIFLEKNNSVPKRCSDENFLLYF